MKMKRYCSIFSIIFCFLISQSFAAELTELKDEKEHAQLVKILEQAHRIYAEGWKVLLRTSGAPPSPMKILAEKLQKQKGKKFVMVSVPELLERDFIAGRISLEFIPEQYPQAFGDSMVILNRKAKCDVVFENLPKTKALKIKSLKCTGLGRNLSKTEHIEFHQFTYESTAQQILEMKADKYENLLKKIQCSSAEPCLQMKVPLEGKIKIIDNRIIEKEVVPVMAPPPQIENVQEAPPPQNQQHQQNQHQNPSIQNQESEHEKSDSQQKRTEAPAEGDGEPGL